ncbi:TcaA NTF2-like domain-containing protein [Bacillus wiedmannii]|uniref:TcaA NTF2-like domain-containing protein n=1 Tax=Bacillus wiedmannii TaxID=1890302 RepID=UPI003D96680A
MSEMEFTGLTLTLAIIVFLLSLLRWNLNLYVSGLAAMFALGTIYDLKWGGVAIVLLSCLIMEIMKEQLHKLIVLVCIALIICSIVIYHFQQKEDTDTKTITTQQSDYVLTSTLEENIHNHFTTYVKALVTAINSGDFSQVSPYIDTESAFYQKQKKLVSNLYSRDISETFYEAQVQSIKELQTNLYEIKTYEKIGVTKNNEEKVKEFHYTYRVIKKDNELYMQHWAE